MNKRRVMQTVILSFIMSLTMSVVMLLCNMYFNGANFIPLAFIRNWMISMSVALPLAYVLPSKIAQFVDRMLLEEELD